MAILQIREAQREGAKLLIGIAGTSGSGKTYSALQLAFGMANYDSSKVGLLDAENRRGSLYSDIIKDESGNVQKFLIGDLFPPFSPQRYVEAIREFQETGIKVLIIDSVTHEWEGEGGASEIAETNSFKGMPNWMLAKRLHKKFVNQLLLSDMHVIVCVRARDKVQVGKDSNGKTEFVSTGLTPVQEKNFMFEMTASILMENEGKSQTVLKCPSDLKNILGRGNGYITSEDGKALTDWVGGAKKYNKKAESYRNRLIMKTDQGLEQIKACWELVPEDIRDYLGEGFKSTLFESAQAYDEFKAAPELEEEEDLNERISGKA